MYSFQSIFHKDSPISINKVNLNDITTQNSHGSNNKSIDDKINKKYEIVSSNVVQSFKLLCSFLNYNLNVLSYTLQN